MRGVWGKDNGWRHKVTSLLYNGHDCSDARHPVAKTRDEIKQTQCKPTAQPDFKTAHGLVRAAPDAGSERWQHPLNCRSPTWTPQRWHLPVLRRYRQTLSGSPQ